MPKLVIFDKDGTLIASHGNRPANAIAEQELLPGVAEMCAALRAEGHTLAIASNQGGVAFGFITASQAYGLVAHAARLIGARDFAVCPHHPQGKLEAYAIECECRKPKPGMLLSLMERLGYSADDTIYIGDQESDRQAAREAGVEFIHANDFFDRGR
jgi:D-glycero-D-manno-heptose 1,7-bisphosphate phosphatase